MTKAFLILFLSLSASVFAGVIKDHARYFQTTGSIASFEWAPERYKNDFRYDVLYYIPEGLKDSENVKTLIFMHGGGASTMTRDGSLNVARSYMNSDVIRLANDLQMAVVVPSASGLNWGGHTIGMIRDLNHLMRRELDVDHNNMGLAGHSMGGMGIGRSFPLLASEFAYFLPMASGIDVAHQSEEHLNKVFNVPYVHLQGLRDHFTIFIERCEEQIKRTSLLAQKYNLNSKLQIIYYEGAHNSDYGLTKSNLERLQKTPRNIFQDNLFGTLHYNDKFTTENHITYHQTSSPRYFWVEMLDADGETPERLDFRANVKNNVISLKLLQRPKNIKRLRVNLSKEMFNEKKMVELYVNDVLIEKRMMKDRGFVDRVDRAFEFDDYIDVNL